MMLVKTGSISMLGFIAFCTATLLVVEGAVADRDLTLTASQKFALDKLKNAVEPMLKQNYKKQEIYLIKWLRGVDFDPKSATRKIISDTQWRKELRMDTVQNEDWSDLQSRFEYNVDGVDKSGQPLLLANFGSWDFRQAMVSGQRSKLERYIYKMLDDVAIEVRKRQEEGKHVTRSNLLINLDGYNTIQHGCIPCISFYLKLAAALDAHFPELFDKMIMINVPSIFELVLNIVKPALPLELQKSIVLFGTSKREWQPYLRQLIDDDQLPFEYGGTKATGFFY